MTGKWGGLPWFIATSTPEPEASNEEPFRQKQPRTRCTVTKADCFAISGDPDAGADYHGRTGGQAHRTSKRRNAAEATQSQIEAPQALHYRCVPKPLAL